MTPVRVLLFWNDIRKDVITKLWNDIRKDVITKLWNDTREGVIVATFWNDIREGVIVATFWNDIRKGVIVATFWNDTREGVKFMSIKLPPKRNIHRPIHLYLNNKIYFITGKTFKECSYFDTDYKKKIFTRVLNNLIKQMIIKVYAWVLLNNHYHLLVGFADENNNSLTAVTPVNINPTKNSNKDIWNDTREGVITKLWNDTREDVIVATFWNDIREDVMRNNNNALTGVTPTDVTPTGVTPANFTPILPKFINRLHSITALNINKINNTPKQKIWYQYFDRIIRSEKDFWTRFNYIHNNPIKHGYIKNPDKLPEYKFSSYNYWLKKNSKEWMASCFAQHPIIDFSCENDD